MEIIDFKSINKGSVIAKFTLKIHKWGDFLIKEMAYFKKDTSSWIQFPTRQYEKDGQKKYFHLCGFSDPEMLKSFQGKVIELLEKYIQEHPEKTGEPPKMEIGEIPF